MRNVTASNVIEDPDKIFSLNLTLICVTFYYSQNKANHPPLNVLTKSFIGMNRTKTPSWEWVENSYNIIIIRPVMNTLRFEASFT